MKTLIYVQLSQQLLSLIEISAKHNIKSIIGPFISNLISKLHPQLIIRLFIATFSPKQ